MKMIKILLAPIRIFLTVTIAIFKFLLSISSTILAIISFVVFMVSIFFFLIYTGAEGQPIVVKFENNTFAEAIGGKYIVDAGESNLGTLLGASK